MTSIKKIILFGIKHSGKTTLGKIAAGKIDVPFYDLDFCIESETKKEGKSIRDFFKEEDKLRFYSIEYGCLQKIVSAASDSFLISTGGGIIDNVEALKIIPKNYCKIFLDNDPDVLFERILKSGLPPFLQSQNPMESFLQIYKNRTIRYKKIADVILDIRDLQVNDAVELIVDAIGSYGIGVGNEINNNKG